MNYIKKKFTNFMNISLKILFLLIILGSIGTSLLSFINLSFKNIIYSIIGSLILFLICLLIGYFIYKLLGKGYSDKVILLIILLLAFSLRLLYILLIDVKPFSDFEIIYNCGQKFAAGDYSVFKGTSYLARFSHLTIITIYFGEIIKLFPNALMIIKLINVILSTINIYIFYLIIYYENKKSIKISILLIVSFLIPLITANSILLRLNITEYSLWHVREPFTTSVLKGTNIKALGM